MQDVGRSIGSEIISAEVLAACSGGPRGNEQLIFFLSLLLNFVNPSFFNFYTEVSVICNSPYLIKISIYHTFTRNRSFEVESRCLPIGLISFSDVLCCLMCF